MPHFVILEHDHPFLHWDLMLESGSALRSWRLLQRPEPGQAVAAEPLGDHRIFYLDYEGPVGGGRGTVVRWDSGTFEWCEQAPDRLVLQLTGQILHGRAVLWRAAPERWSFLFPLGDG
jgi:DNA polymerase Ligase (LigD)